MQEEQLDHWFVMNYTLISTHRINYEEMKQELRIVSKNLKEAEVQYNILLIEKDEIQDKFARDLLEVSKEKDGGKEEITQLMVRQLQQSDIHV